MTSCDAHSNFDITRDGKHFVAVAAHTVSGPETIIVLHWLTALHARLASAP